MKVLVIGLGSIAQKHIHAIKFLRPDAEIFALRSSNNAPALSEIQNIYSWDEVPKDLKFILISNPTSEHLNTIQKALAYRVPIFLEKPPLMSMDGAEETMKQVTAFSVPVYTAFNLRFYPLIEWTKNNLPLEKVLEVQVYCGIPSRMARWSGLPEKLQFNPGTWRRCSSRPDSRDGLRHLDFRFAGRE
jgi:predicted dehydrogenase